MRLGKKNEDDLRSRTKTELRSKSYFIKDKNDYRLVWKFKKQQKKVLDDIMDRRFEGKAVSTNWTRMQMRRYQGILL